MCRDKILSLKPNLISGCFCTSAQKAAELELGEGGRKQIILSSLKRMFKGDLLGDSSAAPCIPLHNNNNSSNHQNHNNNNTLILGMDKKPLSKEEMAVLQKIEEANR